MSQTFTTYDEVISRFRGVKMNADGTKGMALCPVHDDTTPSMGFAIGRNGSLLVKCHACGANVGEIAEAIGLSSVDFRDPEKRSIPAREYLSKKEPVAVYYYRDEEGKDLYKVERIHKIDGEKTEKLFLPYRWEDGEWKRDLQDIRRVVYRLPEILSRPDDLVVLVEGEKDADNISEIGFLGTTSPGGNQNFNLSLADQLRGRDVLIIPDYDRPNKRTGKRAGKEGALLRARCLDGVASRVRFLHLPIKEGEDASDWIEQGGTKEEFLRLIGSKAWDFSSKDNDARIEEAAEGIEELRGDKDSTRIAKTLIEELFTDSEGRLLLRTYQDQFYTYKGNRYAAQSFARFKYKTVWDFTSQELAKKNRIKIATGSDDKTPEVIPTTEGLVQNILGGIKAETFVDLLESEDEEPSLPFWVDERNKSGTFAAFQNGIVNLEELIKKGTTKTLAHSPEWFSPFVLPYNYNSRADISDDFSGYMMRVFEGDIERINLAQEWFGYCLLNSNKYQKFLALEGGGANGKSVFCVLLTALVGLEYVSNVGLERFADKFSLAGTVGKLINISSDTGELDKAAEGAIKQFTAGDRMLFERKNQDPFSQHPTARLVVAWNNRPRFADRTDGLWRRMMILPFNATIPENERRSEFTEESWWIESGQMEGILLWAIEGLRRLEEQGGFTKPKISEAAISQYRLELNPAEAFLLETFVSAPECRVPVDELFELYRAHCHEGNYRPTNKSNFGREVRRIFPSVERSRSRENGKRVSYYEGLGFQGDEPGGAEKLFT